MNQNHHTQPSARQPLCAAFEPLLPLLSLSLLDAEEIASVRSHIATCDYCQSQMDDFDFLRDALRREAAQEVETAQVRPAMTVAAILDAARGGDSTASDDLTLSTGPHQPRASTTTPLSAPMIHVPRGRWSLLGALAAVLLLGVLAAELFGRPGGQYGATAIPGVGVLTTFPLPHAGSHPKYLVAGRDGNLWFTYDGGIGRITPRGMITEFGLPAGIVLNGLTMGRDGMLWFTDGTGKIGRFNPRDSHVNEFTIPASGAIPGDIIAGSDSNVWFIAEFGQVAQGGFASAEIGRITPSGVITEFPLHGIYPAALAAGPNGNVWFDIYPQIMIGRITPQGTVTTLPLPLHDGPGSIVPSGPDGNLWAAECSSRACGILRITPGGVITSFALPDAAAANPGDLVVGPDSSLWFTDGSHLGRVTPTGVITEFTLPPGINLNSLALGPDDRLWFTNPAANTIGRLELTG